MIDEQIAAAKAELEDLRREIREDFAKELGGEPEDYNAERAVADGGEQSCGRSVGDTDE